jgi:hypothetical protein
MPDATHRCATILHKHHLLITGYVHTCVGHHSEPPDVLPAPGLLPHVVTQPHAWQLLLLPGSALHEPEYATSQLQPLWLPLHVVLGLTGTGPEGKACNQALPHAQQKPWPEVLLLQGGGELFNTAFYDQLPVHACMLST